jgi:hypothetical protein
MLAREAGLVHREVVPLAFYPALASRLTPFFASAGGRQMCQLYLCRPATVDKRGSILPCS